MTGTTPATPVHLRLALVGPPGSGKGTQSRLLAERYHLEPVSTGQLLRDLAKRHTPVARVVRGLLEAGRLVPNRIVLELVRRRLADLEDDSRGWIMDGFPRTTPQARAFGAMLQDRALDAVIELHVPPDVVTVRLAERGRHDDEHASIDRRMRAYQRETVPMIEHLERSGAVLRVDGDQPIEQVHAQITARLTPVDGVPGGRGTS
ncbi:MAG TPA: nucleoside monophosphate kinase [Acidimicrobiia bacterium]|nr:nucleoside monophosphate kinase [Acidimicrobiia bacterium]